MAMLQQEQQDVSAYELASYRLGRDVDALTGWHFERLQIAMLGGCGTCGASIAAYNAYPSKHGSWRCADCIGDDGWQLVHRAHMDIFGSKTYLGRAGEHSVMVVPTAGDPGTLDDRKPYALRHVVKHSPTGFSWGYDGSGPSDLARCILIDVLGESLLCEQCDGTGQLKGDGRCFACHGETYDPWLQNTYMAFRSTKIALQPMAGDFAMSEETVRAWLQGRRAS
jgi:hypothetical protein